MKALPSSRTSSLASTSALTSTRFDRSPVDAATLLVPPSQRFDPTRLSMRRLLRRMPDGSVRAVHFDAGWDKIALGVEHELSLLQPDFAITIADARWAELRIVTSVDDEAGVRRILREAAAESMTRCEKCGEPGRPVRCMPRQRTLCLDHAVEHRFDEAVRVTVEQLRAPRHSRSA